MKQGINCMTEHYYSKDSLNIKEAGIKILAQVDNM